MAPKFVLILVIYLTITGVVQVHGQVRSISSSSSTFLNSTTDDPCVDKDNTCQQLNGSGCFCDSFCFVFGDCCKHYVETLESSYDATKLPRHTFTCLSISGKSADTIYVINECPDSYDIDYIRDGCRRGSSVGEGTSTKVSTSDQFYRIPVTSRMSGLVYRNLFCAICHREMNTTFWSVKAESNSPKLDALLDRKDNQTDEQNVKLVRNQTFLNQATLLYTAPVNRKPRNCIQAVDSCSLTWLDDQVSTRCHNDNDTRYVYDENRQTVFRNWHCAVCNELSVGNISCSKRLSRPLHRVQVASDDGGANSFVILLDLNTGKGNVVGRPGGPATEERLRECPQYSIYDPFAAICRQFSCPPGLSFNDAGECSNVIEASEVRSAPDGEGIDRDDQDRFSSGGYQSCPMITLDQSEYRMYGNGTIDVPLYNISYSVGKYVVDRVNSSVLYICSPFTDRNYTEKYTGSSPTLLLDQFSSYLSLICSIISLAALAFQFMVYMSFPVLRNRPGQLVICLVVALFVGQLLFVLVSVSSQAGYVFCVAQSVVMHYCYLAAFGWMNVMSIDVYRTFSSSAVSSMLASSASGTKRFVIYSLYAWGFSGLVVLTGLLLDLTETGGDYRPQYAMYGLCWFGSRYGLLFFFALPLGVILVVNVGLFIASVVQIQRASKATRIAVQKPANFTLMMIYGKLSVVMGLGWMIGFLAAFTDSSFLWILFILLNSLQGAFICAAFVLTRQVLRLICERVRICLHLPPQGEPLTSSTSGKPSSSSNTKTTSAV